MDAHIRKAEYKNKNGKNLQPRLPIPQKGDPRADDWPVYYGRLEDSYITVCDPEDVDILSNHGFFGRSTLAYKSDNKELFEKRVKFGRKKDWQNVEMDNTESSEEEKCIDKKLPRDSPQWRLCFEEALFLSYALGVLVVSLPTTQLLTIDDMWRIFTTRRTNFAVEYAVYHHYRSNDWIVKSGLKSGCNWALYPDGPPYSHAQFLVWIKCIWSDNCANGLTDANRTYGLNSFAALERVTNSVSKNLMLCTVIRPRTLSDDHLKDISCLGKFQIVEVVMQRFIPDQF